MIKKTKRILIFTAAFACMFLCAAVFAACSHSSEHEHSFTDWVVTTQATCVKSGVKERVCYTCGEHQNEELPATGHVYGEWGAPEPATCDKDGQKSRVCIFCTFVQSETTPALGHSYADWTVVRPPECTADGLRVRTCSRCGTESEEVMPATGHTLSSVKGLEPTCTESGYADYEICSDCGYSTMQTIPATGHGFAETWSHDDKEHWHAVLCGHSDAALRAPHVYTGGICTFCEYKPAYTIGLEFTLLGSGGGYAVSCGTASGKITVPDKFMGLPVTAVVAGGFRGRADIISVELGHNVVTLGDEAFFGCSKLENIELGNVKYFGVRALGDCSALKSVKLDGAASIGEYAFSGCSALKSVAVPKGVKSIGRAAFYRCDGLEQITLPFIGATLDGDITHFGHVFGALTSVVNGNVVPAALKKAVITGGTVLADQAFEKCAGITTVELPDTLIEAGSRVFDGVPVKMAVLPSLAVKTLPAASVTHVTVTSGNIWTDAFKGFAELKSIVMTGEDTLVIGSHAFEGCAKLENVAFPPKLDTVLDYAFRNCSSLKSIDLPESTTGVANYAFADCSAATALTLGKNVDFIGSSAFMNCAELTAVTVPEGIDTVGSGAFSGCVLLKTVSLPESLTGISSSMFNGCTSLARLDIPRGVTSIGGGAFEGCSALKTFTVPDTVTSIGRGAFGGCASLTEITLPFVGDRVKEATFYSQYPFGYIFYSKKNYAGCTAVEQKYHAWDMTVLDGSAKYAIPDSLKTVKITGGIILSGAFYNCAGLQKVTIGAGVTSIEPDAFYGCTGLAEIEFERKTGWSAVPPSASAGAAFDVTDSRYNAARLIGEFGKFRITSEA